MATTNKWGPVEAIVSLLSTELNSLANSTSITTGKVLSAAIANQTNLYQVLSLELLATFGVAPDAAGYVGGWILYSLDGTNYEDGSTTVDPQRPEDFYIPLRAVTSAQRVRAAGVGILPYSFKILLRNKSGQAMAASGNTLKYTETYEQGV